MKEFKKEKSSVFSNLFTETPAFSEPLSDWIIPSIYHIKNLNVKQLQFIDMLDIEILDDNEVLFIKLNSKDHKTIISTLTVLGREPIDYKGKLNLIPMWIRKIFKAV
jgi:hypothetical protein